MANWSPDPNQVVVIHDSGDGNMGDVTDEISKARFWLATERFVLVFIRAHFQGTGSGTADLAIRVDSRLGAQHDATLITILARGKTADMNYRVERDEYEKWVFQRGDIITPEWTNPDSPNVQWGLEVGLADAEA